MIHRSYSYPSLVDIVSSDGQETLYITELQEVIQELHDQNTKQASTIYELQNKLEEKKSLLAISTAQNLPKKPKVHTQDTLKQQQREFYKENKNSAQVQDTIQKKYSTIFSDAGISVPWQIIKSVTDDLFRSSLSGKTS